MMENKSGLKKKKENQALNKKENKKRKTKIGKIVSHQTAKTALVEVVRFKAHPLYKKKYRVTKRFMAHDQKDEFKVGDIVEIEECRPISKRKRWTIVRKIEAKPGRNV